MTPKWASRREPTVAGKNKEEAENEKNNRQMR